MKKTPIMEFINYLYQNPERVYCIDEDVWEQKEKAFAFDCFKAGKKYGIDYCMSVEDGMSVIRPDFNQFYSQYAEKHNK